MLQRDDYVLRQIQQLVELVAALIGKDKPPEIDEADEEVDGAYRRLLNMDRQLFETLDAASVAQMLGESERVRMVAQVMQAEADVWRAAGDVQRAARRYRRALSMLQAAEDDGAEAAQLMESLRGRLNGESGE